MKLLELPKNCIIRIKGIPYKQTNDKPRKGNKVLDLRDGRWATIFMKHREVDRVSIGEYSYCVEIAVEMKYLIVLKRITKQEVIIIKSLN